MKRVIGMDISKGIATCAMLEDLPANLQEYSRSNEFTWWHISPCTADLEAIAELEPDLICFEPSGGKYEGAFIHFFRQREIPFRKVSGRKLATYRDEAGLPKDDHFDALALTAYGLEKANQPGALIPEIPPHVEDLRQRWLQRHSLTKQRAGLINRIKLQLAKEFPEAMEFASDRKWKTPTPGLIYWLNGQDKGRGTKKWENLYNGARVQRSQGMVDQPGTCGTGISDYTKLIAKQVLEVENAIAGLEDWIEEELRREEYSPYLEAMDRLNFTVSIKAIWLTRIYPFEKFLDSDGKERVTRRLSNKGKLCTHNQSLAQFKAALGAAVKIDRSGTEGGIAPTKQRNRPGRSSKKKKDKTAMGDKYCRVTFWQWALVRIETQRAEGKLAKRLIDKRNQLKEADKNIYQRSGNLHGYAARLLYRELKEMLAV